MLEILKTIGESSYENIIIMGDFNLKEINWAAMVSKSIDPNNYANKFIERIRDIYFTQHITEPTRSRGSNNPSCLDLVFSNDEELIEEIELLAPLGKSDHSIIKFNVKAKIELPKPKLKIMYEKGNYTQIIQSLKEIDWDNEFEKYPDDIEKQWTFFKENITELESKFVPRKMVYINGKLSKKFSVPLDRQNLRKLKKKNKLWSKVRQNLANEEQKLQYNRLRNQIRRLTRKGKKLVEKNIAKNTKSNPKAFWSYAKQKMNRDSSIPDLIKNEGEATPIYATKDGEKADVFLDYFSSVFTLEPNDGLPFFEKRDFVSELENIDITEEMVLKK